MCLCIAFLSQFATITTSKQNKLTQGHIMNTIKFELDGILHEHLTHDDSESFLCQLDDYNLMSYNATEQHNFELTYNGEVVGTIYPRNVDFVFESVADEIDHYNGEYECNYNDLEDLLYVVFTDGSEHLKY